MDADPSFRRMSAICVDDDDEGKHFDASGCGGSFPTVPLPVSHRAQLLPRFSSEHVLPLQLREGVAHRLSRGGSGTLLQLSFRLADRVLNWLTTSGIAHHPRTSGGTSSKITPGHTARMLPAQRQARSNDPGRRTSLDEAVSVICIGDSDGSELEIIGGRPCVRRKDRRARLTRASNITLSKRNATPEPPLAETVSCPFGSSTLLKGKTVELHDGNFLRITTIIDDVAEPGRVRLRGWRFRRTRELDGFLPKKKNEVCMLLDVLEDDDRGPFHQGVEEVGLSEVVRIRRLYMTNRDWPELSHLETVPNLASLTDEEIDRDLDLLCRWKRTTYYETEEDRRKGRQSEVVISRVREDEVDMATKVPEASSVSDADLRRRWRGETTDARLTTSVPKEAEAKTAKEMSGPVASMQSALLTPQSSRVQLRAHSSARSFYSSSSTSTSTRKTTLRVDLTAETKTQVVSPPQSPTVQAVERRQRRSGFDFSQAGTLQAKPDVIALDEELSSSQQSYVKRPHCEFVEIRSSRETTLRNEVRTPKRIKGALQCHTPPPASGIDSAEGMQKAKGLDSHSVTPCRSSQADSSGHNPVYTFGDCFCGAGGMSSAAEQAGLQVLYGFDQCLRATDSYRRNHPHARCYHASSHHFHALSDENFQVDFLHLSPPCQPWSAAHTIPGKDDEANIAALFAVSSLIEKIRPRIATLEETEGLVTRYPDFFVSVVHQLTMHGYSVRYRVVNLAEYGLVQARQRVFMVAAW